MNSIQKWFAAIVAVGFVLVLPACGARGGKNNQAQPPSSQPAQEIFTDPARLTVPGWILTGLKVDGKEVPLTSKEPASILFAADGKVSGFAGCNRYGGSYQAENGGKLTFGGLFSTKMYCHETMAQEDAFLQGLGKVQRFQESGITLTLSSQDQATVFTFKMLVR